jgi:hypothetical protein
MGSSLRFSDNSTLRGSSDKLHKLIPFLNSLQKILKSIPLEEKVFLDEKIIPFKGKHSLKVYMQKKPKSGVIKYFHFVILLM